MFTVTHSIQSAIPLSSCCEVSINERTLNLRSYHMQHSTSALSTINITAAHNISRRNTQGYVPNTTRKAFVPATACLTLKSCACCILLTYQICAGYPKKVCIYISYRYPNSGATFGFLNVTLSWRKFYGGFTYPTNDATFHPSCVFFAYTCKSRLLRRFDLIAISYF